MKQQRGAQCVIFNHEDSTLYCVFNSKHNKYAPIGGKYEDDETDGITALLRETNEELEIGDVIRIRELGVHTLTDTLSDTIHFVVTFILYVSSIKSPKEEFLKLVKLNDVPLHLLNKNTAYTSLVSIVDSIFSNCEWKTDAAFL